MNKLAFQSKFDPAPEVEHLREELARMAAQLGARKKNQGLISEAMASVLKSVQQEAPPRLQFKLPKKSVVVSPVTHAVHITDWHIGQVTNAAHIEQFGEFDHAIAVRRVGQFGQAVIDKTQVMRSAYNVEECHVIGTADWVSGGIHDELIRTEEFPVPVQAVKAGYLLGNFIAGLSAHFKRVKVDLLTAGNHDRITRKPQAEDGGLNSWGYVACEIARQAVQAIPNVELKVHVALNTVIEVGGQRYLIAHGHGIKGTWGIPFYGIERKKQKEAMARMNMPVEKHFDRIVIGHFHTGLNHEHWMIGGSLTGTTAFDHQEGRHSKAHQTSWFVHPRHGEFDWSRWWLE